MVRGKAAAGLAAVVLAGVLGVALPGMAQKKDKPNSPIGFVDLGQVTEEIKKTTTWQAMVRDFEDRKAKFAEELKQLNNVRYLSQQELQELQTLRAKQKPTDAELARIRELEDKSTKLEQEFQNLALVEKPSAEQSKRIQDLRSLREGAVTALQAAAQDRSGKLQEMEGKVLEEMQGKILKVVEQIAEKNNLTMVLDKQAILYGGQDLTQDVVKKLK